MPGINQGDANALAPSFPVQTYARVVKAADSDKFNGHEHLVVRYGALRR